MANAARIIRGNKGLDSRILVCDGFMYQLNRSRNGSMYWRCGKKDCRSALKTNIFNIRDPNAIINIITNNNVHNHPHEDQRIEELIHVNQMKDSIVAEPTAPIKRVYNNIVGRIHQNAIPGWTARCRSSEHPRFPPDKVVAVTHEAVAVSRSSCKHPPSANCWHMGANISRREVLASPGQWYRCAHFCN